MIAGILSRPIETSLSEEVLSDAICAASLGNLRRAVLETALACEIAVKQALFSGSPESEAAFAYLEDKGQVSASVHSLIGEVLREATGQDFKTEEPESYKLIELLFRARNKAAHRATLKYRDHAGQWQTVDDATYREWRKAAEKLIDWLASLG